MDEIIEISKKFETLFRQHYRQLCSYAYTFLKDVVSSEDIVQEVFIKIWENQKMNIGNDNLKFYLFTAVRNNCLTRLQKNKKGFLEELKDEDNYDEIRLRIDDEKTTNPKTLIAKALDQLPPKCREVFLLSRISGLTYQQVADSLGISVKTVENQMGKAIRLLKVFAKDNKIYFVVLFFLCSEKITFQSIGVFIGKWF